MKIFKCERDLWGDEIKNEEISLSDVFYELETEYQGDNIGIIEALQNNIRILFSIFRAQIGGKSFEEAVIQVANQEISQCTFKIEAD